jgi:thiamine-phosphate pyrophosphorylase
MHFNFNIYPVITEKFCKNKSAVDTLRILVDSGIKIVQLREKEYSKKHILELAREFRRITKRAGVQLVINDHVDIAHLVDAEAVHLGQDDLPCDMVKQKYPHLGVGVSTHNLSEASRAESDKADYINIGPVFATSTKETCTPPLGIQKIKEISQGISIPFTVMGGIKLNNVSELIKAGVKRVAMITEITMSDDISETLKQLNRLIK